MSRREGTSLRTSNALIGDFVTYCLTRVRLNSNDATIDQHTKLSRGKKLKFMGQ